VPLPASKDTVEHDTTLAKTASESPTPKPRRKPGKPGGTGLKYVIAVDSREQLPYDFKGHKTITRCLETGDYSVQGWLPWVAVERKSWADFYSCLTGNNRERFERELERLSKMRFSAVVVEANHRDLWKPFIYRVRGGKSRRSQVPPLVAQKSVIAWSWRFCNIWFCENRQQAMKWTWLLLNDAVRQLVREEQELAKRG
jgi:hypothetical protein